MKKASIIVITFLMIFLISCSDSITSTTTIESTTTISETTTNIEETTTETTTEETTTETTTVETTTELIVETTYASDDWIRVLSTDYKWGFVDNEGNVIIPIEYDNTSVFRNGFAILFLDGHEGLINEDLEIVIPIIYDGVNATSSENEYFFASDDQVRKYLFDKFGNIIYEFNDTFQCDSQIGNFIIVYNGEKYGLYDFNGNQIFDFVYYDLSFISEDYFFARDLDYANNIINMDQEIIVSDVNINADFNILQDEYLQIYVNKSATIYDNTGTMLFTLPTNVKLDFSEDLVSFYHQDGKYGLVDIEGNILFEPSYTLVDNYYNGNGLFEKLWTDGTSQVIFSTEGTILYSSSDDEVRRFTDQLIILTDSETQYYYAIDYDGNTVLEPRVNEILCVENFYGDNLLFRAEEELSLYRKYEVYYETGEFLMLLETDIHFIFNLNNGLICSYTDGITVMTFEGESILELENVTNITIYNYGIMVYYNDHTTAIYDIEGNLIIPPIYVRVDGPFLDNGFENE